MNPLTIGAILSGGVGLLSSFFGSGKSPKEEEIGKILDKLMGQEDWFKDTSFTKEEIMSSIVPAIQSFYAQGADIMAGNIGARTGESDVAGGQAAQEYYTQALAPIIAQGQEGQAKALQWGTEFAGKIDDQSKNRMLQFFNLLMGGASQLGDLNSSQQGWLNFLTGATQGANMFGTGAMANYYMNKKD